MLVYLALNCFLGANNIILSAHAKQINWLLSGASSKQLRETVRENSSFYWLLDEKLKERVLSASGSIWVVEQARYLPDRFRERETESKTLEATDEQAQQQ